MSIKIAPSILSADFIKLGDDIKTVEDGGADLLHLDVMDGHMVPNITFGPPLVDSINAFTSLFLETHLMITNPELFIEPFRRAGADRIIIHAEAADDVPALLKHIKRLGAQAGVSIKPKTPFNILLPYLEDIDLILFMTVEPGFGGQAFMPEVLSKIEEARHAVEQRGLAIALEVDGGIDPQTAPLVIAAGATVLVAGSAIFKTKNRAETIARLRAAPEIR